MYAQFLHGPQLSCKMVVVVLISSSHVFYSGKPVAVKFQSDCVYTSPEQVYYHININGAQLIHFVLCYLNFELYPAERLTLFLPTAKSFFPYLTSRLSCGPFSAVQRYKDTRSSGLSKPLLDKFLRPAVSLIHDCAVDQALKTLRFHVCPNLQSVQC